MDAQRRRIPLPIDATGVLRIYSYIYSGDRRSIIHAHTYDSSIGELPRPAAEIYIPGSSYHVLYQYCRESLKKIEPISSLLSNTW